MGAVITFDQFSALKAEAVKANQCSYTKRAKYMPTLRLHAPFLASRIYDTFEVAAHYFVDDEGSMHAELPPSVTYDIPGQGEPGTVFGIAKNESEALVDLFYRMSYGLPARHKVRRWLDSEHSVAYVFDRNMGTFCAMLPDTRKVSFLHGAHP